MPIILTPTPTGGVVLEIDPTSEDAANVSLVLVDNTTYFLTGENWPSPEVDQSTVSSISTEGEVPVTARHHNTTGTIQLRVIGSTAAALQTALNYIDKKLAKIMREGGTLKRTTPSGATYVTDLIAGGAAFQFDRRYTASNRCDVTITVPRRPYWRGAAVTLSTHSETTLPCNIFIEAAIAGDVPALGRLIVTEAQAQDQWWLTYGVQSRYYSSSADAALFYEAEGRTALGGGATTAVGPTGASGAGSNTVLANNLATTYQSILSTQASGGGNHLSHIGDFQVYARVQVPIGNTGDVTIALEWAQGDFVRRTRNTAVSLAGTKGLWKFINLGQISIAKVAQGTQRWEGRIIALSTITADDIYVDHLTLIPVTEGAGIIKGIPNVSTPSTFTALDGFDQTSGVLAGQTMAAGGTWTGAGDTDDFTTTGASTVTRTAVSDASTSLATGRLEIAGTATPTDTLVGVNISTSDLTGTVPRLGVLARYTDTNNFLAALLVRNLVNGQIVPMVFKRVAGVETQIDGLAIAGIGITYGTAANIRLLVTASGRFAVWVSTTTTFGAPIISGSDAALATGGALASGKVGMYDRYTSAGALTRTYDSFAAWVPISDAAVFASRQLEIRDNRVIRQDSAGAVWATPSSFEGDYLLIPASGREGRTTRVIVKACRNDPATGADAAIDDISAQLVYTPRFLTLPE